jgi:hypothetical protein
MKNRSRTSIAGVAPLQALFAIVFLLMTALQPGLFATANATGFHTDAGITLRTEKPVRDVAGHVCCYADQASAADTVSDDAIVHQYGDKTPSDKSCEVHCAPAYAVPVDSLDIEVFITRCFAPSISDASSGGEYTAFVRPPKHLI